jgi:uncharacterized protein (TIGR01777 family)
MRVVVSGASGLIGPALVASLIGDGHDVVRLVRRPVVAADEVRWDPMSGSLDVSALGRVDAAVNLSGAGVGDHRWTSRYKQEIRDSRVRSTTTLATALAALPDPPSVLVNASAIGWYGTTGDVAVDESAPRGNGFLAEVCEAWEASTSPARDAGIRVVLPRTGLVVSASGGAWKRLIPLFRAGIGGRIGNGRQFWSTISLADEVRALRFCLEHEALAGPVNLTSPVQATNAEVTAVMGELLHRPTVLPVPPVALRAALGEFAGEIVASQRVAPRALVDAGFTFLHADFRAAFAAALDV